MEQKEEPKPTAIAVTTTDVKKIEGVWNAWPKTTNPLLLDVDRSRYIYMAAKIAELKIMEIAMHGVSFSDAKKGCKPDADGELKENHSFKLIKEGDKHSLIANKMSKATRAHFIGRVLPTNTALCFAIGKVLGVELYLDGSEQLAGKSGQFCIAWWVPATAQAEDASMKLSFEALEFKLPQRLGASNELDTVKLEMPVLVPVQERPQKDVEVKRALADEEARVLAANSERAVKVNFKHKVTR